MRKRVTIEFSNAAHERLKKLKKVAQVSSQSSLINLLCENLDEQTVKDISARYRSAIELEKQRRAQLRSKFGELPLDEQERLLGG